MMLSDIVCAILIVRHSDPRALVLCHLILSTSANPPNTGRAAVLYTAQLLCLCWLDWQTLKESSHTAPTPADHCVHSSILHVSVGEIKIGRGLRVIEVMRQWK